MVSGLHCSIPKGRSAPGKVSMLPTLVPPTPVPTNVSTRALGDSAPVGGIVDDDGVGLGALDEVLGDPLVLAEGPPHPPRPTTASMTRVSGERVRRSPLRPGIPTRTACHATRGGAAHPGAHGGERRCACAPA